MAFAPSSNAILIWSIAFLAASKTLRYYRLFLLYLPLDVRSIYALVSHEQAS